MSCNCEDCQKREREGKKPEITVDEIKLTIEQPDSLTMQCSEHLFYVKNFEGKGQLLVYALKDGIEKYSIQCADWLNKNPNKEVVLKC